MTKLTPDEIDYAKSLNIRTLERLFEAHAAELERAVLRCSVASESDFTALAIRRAELEGARKLSTSVLSYLTSLRKRNPPG